MSDADVDAGRRRARRAATASTTCWPRTGPAASGAPTTRCSHRAVAVHILAADDERAEPACSRPRARAGAGHRPPAAARARRRVGRRPVLRRQRVGPGRLPRHPARRARARCRRGGRPGSSPRSPTASPRRTPPASPTAGWSPRTSSSTSTGRSGSSASASTPPCTGCRRAAISVDEIDLAGLLYCALTGKWAGVSVLGRPAGAEVHGEVLRPRRVRAGIPRPLDALCDQVLNPPRTRRRATRSDHSARAIRRPAPDFVGDLTGTQAARPGTRPAADRPRPTQPTRRPTRADAAPVAAPVR